MRKIFYFLGTSWKHFRGYRFLFVFCFFLKIVRMALGLVTPLFFASLVSMILEGNQGVIAETLLIIFGLSLGEILIGDIAARIEIYIKKNINFAVKKSLFNKLLNIPQYELNKYSDGKLFSIIASESVTVTSYIFFLVGSWLSAINLIATGIIIFILNWQLSLAVLISYPLIYFINRAYGRKIRNNALLLNKKSDEFIGFHKNTITNLDELKNRNQYCSIVRIFSDLNAALKNLATKQEVAQQNYTFLSGIIGLLNNILFLGLGAFFVISGVLPLGNFISFNTYSKSFSSTLNGIINLNTNIQPSITMLERVDEIEKLYGRIEREEKTKESVEIIDGDIRFENVYFSFGAKRVIDGLSVMITRNRITAIVGKNGSGKTTVANLIIRKYLPDTGAILINGIDSNRYRYKDVQRNIAYIRQRPNLFYMSIRENLLLFSGSDCRSQIQIEQACSLVGLLDDIKNLPDGFDMVINEKTQLSIGQIQKIQLARAVLQNAPIIICDELSANLDRAAQEDLLDSIKTIFRDKTVIFITHKQEELKVCDYVYNLEEKNFAK